MEIQLKVTSGVFMLRAPLAQAFRASGRSFGQPAVRKRPFVSTAIVFPSHS